jgi:hypothetical protein
VIPAGEREKVDRLLERYGLKQGGVAQSSSGVNGGTEEGKGELANLVNFEEGIGEASMSMDSTP